MLLLAGCATIAHGPNETIAVDSQPRGAAASIACDGGVTASGTTPAKLVIPRKADGCVVEVSANGRAKRVTLHRGYSGRYWANFGWLTPVGIGAVSSFGSGNDDDFTIGGIAGLGLTGIAFIVDAASGSMYDRDQHELFVDLDR
jgi:hypothetical protein